MNKVYAGIASVGFLVLGSQSGCSSADPPTGSGGTTSVGATSSTAGTGVVPTGGTPAGTAGTAAAGTSAAGTGTGGSGTAGSGTAGTGTAGTGTGGTGGTGVADPACKGIKTGVACTPEGTACPGLACGLADSGTRSCNCATTWMCLPCDYATSPFKDKPAEVPVCSGIEADNVPCTEADKQKVCSSAGGEVCACWTDNKGALIWDCDKPPTTWGAL